MGRSRDIAGILGKSEAQNINNLAFLNTSSPTGVDSAQVKSIGLEHFSTVDSLPISNLEAGQQAYVSGTNRLYMSNGSGWFNVGLINASPSLTIDPTGTIVLATDGSPTTITLTATDSDTPGGLISFSVESDGSFAGLGTLSQDSSVFTITPLVESDASTTSATLTFKASDGVNFGSGTVPLTLTFAPGATQNSHKTIALITADDNTAGNNFENFQDFSGNNVTLTLNGTGDGVSKQSYSPYVRHSIFMFKQNQSNGGGGLVWNASADWYFAQGDFTIEWWQYWHEQQDGYGTLLDINYSTNSNLLIQTTNNDNQYNIWMNGGSNIEIESSAADENQWYHYALVRNGSGSNNIKLYRNGVVTAQMTYTGNVGNNIAMGIGKAVSQSTHNIDNSSICDFRIVKGTAVYTDTFTPPTEPLTEVTGTVLMTGTGGMIKDYSSKNHTLKDNGASPAKYDPGLGNDPYYASTIAFTPYDHLPYDETNAGGSYFFTRSQGGYLTGTLPSIGTGPYTIQTWIRLKDVGSNSTFFTNAVSVTGKTLQWYLQSASKTISVYGDGSTINSSRIPPINSWIHIALVRDANYTRFYMNGASLWSIANTSNATLDNDIGGSGLAIGSYPSGEYMDGWMSDYRISDVPEYMYGNQSTFPVPTAPLYGTDPVSGVDGTTTGNVKLHIATGKDLTVIDKSRTVPHINHDGGLTGTSTAQAKWGTHSLAFGTGRYILSNVDYTTGYGDDLYDISSPESFTIESWIYVTDNTAYNTIYNTGGGSVSQSYFTQWAVHPTGELNYYRSSTKVLSSSQSDISNNTWHHVAITGDNGTLRLFVDGVLKDTATSASSYYPPTDFDIHIGDRQSGASSGNYPFGGYMQDFRITKGLARYTANYSVPSAAFEG